MIEGHEFHSRNLDSILNLLSSHGKVLNKELT